MAANHPKPEVGDILVVIHDFLARSSDELSLAKGDRVELIEGDDEFGDGWFLGKHLVNGNSGLFPEVYTRTAPRGVTAPLSTTKPSATLPAPSTNGSSPDAPTPVPAVAPSIPSVAKTAPLSMFMTEPSPSTLALGSSKADTTPPTAPSIPSTNRNSTTGAAVRPVAPNQTQDSAVIHETLTVIDEHITDLHSPATASNGLLHHTTDSGSEYSSHLDQGRLSYIQGEETDEEEEEHHTRPQVQAWTADQVAEYLFTTGVEKSHCEVFRDQEITGEVLLAMDQSTLFLKAFDLGSVGRRLKTWQKIKNLQDEVSGSTNMARRMTGSEAGSEASRPRRSRTNTLTNSRSITDERPGSIQTRRLSQTPKLDPITPLTPVSPTALHDSPTRPLHQKRPSAASVRELYHNRRHSSTDFRQAGPPKLNQSGTFPADASHKKQPSFDRGWTMTTASSSQSPRPSSSAGYDPASNPSNPELIHDSPIDIDRGYFSSAEGDGRKRNVLKKRDSVAAHSAKSSYADEQRLRSATALTRHSRYGSVDSVKGDASASAAQRYYGLSGAHRRTASANTSTSIPPAVPAKDTPSPTVTKLDGGVTSSPIQTSSRPGINTDWLSNATAKAGFGGLRAISDAVTGDERSKFGLGTDSKDSPLQSPSSTPSAGPSFELDSPDAKSPLSGPSGARRAPTKKTKKETSAYQRGLQKVGPREAVKDADYSGWMKKKSSTLMTTWKARLFVLKGRRLAYYYSEDDTEEKGLIDISFHRVLPADNDRITGLHATLTGASNTPIMPADSNLPTMATSESAADLVEKGADSMFIFKLVPPRAGLSRAVNFTKPMVHYFAVTNLKQGRMWMAALMKATIDRDDTKPLTTTYQQKTISLAKARAMRHRPPALMNLDEKIEESALPADDEDDTPPPVEKPKTDSSNGLGISFGESDSAVAGLDKLGLQRVESATVKKTTFDDEKSPAGITFMSTPQSA